MALRAAKRVELMCRAQADLRPDPHCLDAAPSGAMQLSHRESVVQFINEVCEDFSLQTQTAGVAVSYFDRYVSMVGEKGLCKKSVQLLAITCVLIASKFSEIKMPGLDDLCEVAHNKYSKAELKAMELETLRVLKWELHAVTPHDALQQLSIATNLAEAGKPFLDHAEFFIDMSYYEYKTLPFPPLVIAACSLLCAWEHLGKAAAQQAHLPQLSALCQASEQDLLRCQQVMQEYFKKTFPQAAEAAAKYRQATLAAAKRPAGTSSPDNVMDALDSPAADAMPIHMTTERPDFCLCPGAMR